MTWALVLGGAQCVYDDLHAAIELFGEPDIVVAVKDIWMEYPKVDHMATYHIDRIPNELEKRRALGYKDPQCIWTYNGVRIPRLPLLVKTVKVGGGSSGLLGAFVGIFTASRAILAGIPMDNSMKHYHNRRRGRAWSEAKIYRPHWEKHKRYMDGRVKSMSGWTKDLLGEPTLEWLKSDGHIGVSSTSSIPPTFTGEGLQSTIKAYYPEGHLQEPTANSTQANAPPFSSKAAKRAALAARIAAGRAGN